MGAPAEVCKNKGCLILSLARPNGEGAVCHIEQTNSNGTYGGYFREEGPLECASPYVGSNGICVLSPDDSADPPKNYCSAAQSQSVADPIALGSGAVYETATDFETAGPQAFKIERHYRSNAGPSKLLGESRWKFSFEYSFDWQNEVLSGPLGQSYYLSYDDNDDRWSATHNGEGPLFLGQHDGTLATATMPDGNTVTFEFSSYFSNYRLKNIKRRDGLVLDISYSNNAELSNQVSSVVDSKGRAVRFLYSPLSKGAVTEAIYSGASSSDDFKIAFTYSHTQNAALGFHYRFNVTSVTRFHKLGPPGSAWTQIDSIGYVYEHQYNPFLMTGLIDARGIRVASWSYDLGSRATSNQRAGGVDAYSISYSAGGSTQTVQNPLGGTSVYGFTLGRRENKLVNDVTTAATANIPASSKTRTYSSGILMSQTDEEGRLISYVRDEFGRPVKIRRGPP